MTENPGNSSENQSKTDEDNPLSQADDILKQFHPELFHKRKLEQGKGVKQGNAGSASAATAPPKKKTKVAPIHGGTPKNVRTRKMFSFEDIIYSFSSGLSDFLGWIANLVPRTFLKALVNIYTALALTILIPGGIAFYAWYNKPPFYITEHCQKRFAALYNEFSNNRISDISNEEWSSFITATEDEMDEMIANLENTSDVDDQLRQLIMWAGRDNLIVMIQKKGIGTNREEEAYKRFYSKIKDLEYRNSEARRKRIEQRGY